jgi:hypothetical protein
MALAATAVIAAPPATVPTCDGIRDAYPILGTQCKTNYAKIDHAPNTAKKRRQTFTARRTVLQIFRKASLCNMMYGMQGRALANFKSGEPGHLTALKNLRRTMKKKKDPNLPARYTAADLDNVSMTKRQCK